MKAHEFGELIRTSREAMNLSLRALALMVGCSAAHQSDVEHGRRWPGPELMAAYARELGIPIERLWDQRARDKLAHKMPEVAALVREVIREELAARPAICRCPNCFRRGDPPTAYGSCIHGRNLTTCHECRAPGTKEEDGT